MQRMLLSVVVLWASMATTAQAQEVEATTLTAPELTAPALTAPALTTPALDTAAIQLRPTLQWTMVKGDRTHGFGLGLELLAFPSESPWRVGALVDAHQELDGARRYHVGLGGGRGGFGLHLGVAYRSEGDYASVTALQLTHTFACGPFGFAARAALPVRTYQPSQGPALETRGFEFGLVMQLGWSFTPTGRRDGAFCRHHPDSARCG